MAKVTKLNLSKQHAADLERICAIGVGELANAAGSLTLHTTHLLRAADLAKLFSNENITKEDAEALATQVVALKRLAVRYSLTSHETLVALTNSLKASAHTERLHESWPARMPILEGMLEDPKILILAKATELYFDHCASLEDVRILTDLRPVFNETRSSVVGAVIFSTLKLDFKVSEGSKSVEIVLDLEDLEKLEQQAVGAKTKTQALRKFMREVVGLDHAVFAEEDSET